MRASEIRPGMVLRNPRCIDVDFYVAKWEPSADGGADAGIVYVLRSCQAPMNHPEEVHFKPESIEPLVLIEDMAGRT